MRETKKQKALSKAGDALIKALEGYISADGGGIAAVRSTQSFTKGALSEALRDERDKADRKRGRIAPRL